VLQREHGLCDCQSAKEVRAQDAFDGLKPGSWGRAVTRIVDAGVVDEDFEVTEAGGDGSGSLLNGGVIGDIDGNESSVDALGSERSGGGFPGCLVARSNQDTLRRRGRSAVRFQIRFPCSLP
jgi:hypothetical protein